MALTSAVVVMRRSRTASCRAVLTANSPAGPVSMRHSRTPVVYSLGRESKLWVKIGAVYNGSCKPQSCQKQKDNYSTATDSLNLAAHIYD